MPFFGVFGGTKNTEPPTRNQREKCYEARDAFFDCLEKNGIMDSIKEKDAAASKCGAQQKVFERDCTATWVDYFKRRRVMEAKKEQLKEQLKNEGANDLMAKAEPNR